MKKLLGFLGLVLVLVSCAQPAVTSQPDEGVIATTVAPSGATTDSVTKVTPAVEGSASGPALSAFGVTLVLKDVPPTNYSWVAPPSVVISNLYPGAQAEYPVWIYNSGNEPATFAVSVRTPDSPRAGYKPFPANYSTWFTISNTSPVVPSKSTMAVLVTVKMPEGTKGGEKIEAGISVIDASQVGFIRTETVLRWLISTR